MHIKSSHHIRLEMIERTLQPESCFQLRAAQRKALLIRDALADDKEFCDALVLKIDHLLGEAVVTPARTRAANAEDTSGELGCARDAA